MDIKRIESYKQFAKYLEYPMIVFEAETGKVIDMNYEAEMILGSHVDRIQMEPGRAIAKVDFWEKLHEKKSLVWHRIRLTTDSHEYLVTGLVNEAQEEDKLIYTLLFETQIDMNIGSRIMERILQNAGIVAVHISDLKQESKYKVEYISQNINQYGYTREQLYDNIITFSDMICPEDWEQIQERIIEDVRNHAEELTVDCRMFTESRDLIPIRILIRYIYNDYGNMAEMEMLIFDLKEETRKNSENMYLSQAVDKMKSVVVVKSYHEGNRILKYVSPNAGILGINAEALMKGYKLTEDYIHPKDRDTVIDTIYQAVANGVTDYEHSYRLVRDDGKQIWVQNEVTVNRISDGEAEISFLLTDITEQKNMERELADLKEEETVPAEAESDHVGFPSYEHNKRDMSKLYQLMAETVSQNADYYSVVLDVEGKLLTNPMGPAKDMGQFYDLFERPQFREQFSKVLQRIRENQTPQSISFLVDKMNVHMILAPIIPKDPDTAHWVVTSFAKNGLEVLEEVINQQWELAQSIANFFYSVDVARNEEKRRKIAELQVQREQKEHQMIMEMITSINREGESVIGELCQKVGNYLSVSHIGIYLENKENESAEKYFIWNCAGEDTAFSDEMELTISEYQKLKQYLNEKQILIIDQKSKELFLKKIFIQADVETIMIQSILSASGIRGYIVFADIKRTRKFEERDVEFAGCVTHIFASMLLNKQKAVRANIVKEGFFEVYDYIRDAVFVKDNNSGNIIFANKAMDKLFGYSLVGMRAVDVVNDQMEQYKNMGGVRKRFIFNKKVVKWQSYMKELDQIMNIVEIHLETLNRTEYSLFILKKNKKKKDILES